ncbi:MAG TPA: DUF4384 domain-containing protein [Myxococcales bacterium]|jgi:hypothetical protein
MMHPSALRLEAHLLDPARSPVSGHVEGCEDCRAHLLTMERQGDDFMRYVYPTTVDTLVPKTARRWSWAGILAPVAALAAAAVVLVVNKGPPADYIGTKGVAIKLNVYAGLEAGARALSDKDQVPASAALRFRIQPARPCHLGIVSVDEHGEVSQLYPQSGDVAPTLERIETLPGGAILDGQPGPERIFAVCSADPLPMQKVEAAVKTAAGTGAASVRALDAIPGLPSGTAQATLLLEKSR